MSGTVAAEAAAELLFQALHGHAHASNPEALSRHGSTTSPGKASAVVVCDECGFQAGASYLDPLEVEALAGVRP